MCVQKVGACSEGPPLADLSCSNTSMGLIASLGLPIELPIRLPMDDRGCSLCGGGARWHLFVTFVVFCSEFETEDNKGNEEKMSVSSRRKSRAAVCQEPREGDPFSGACRPLCCRSPGMQIIRQTTETPASGGLCRGVSKSPGKSRAIARNQAPVEPHSSSFPVLRTNPLQRHS